MKRFHVEVSYDGVDGLSRGASYAFTPLEAAHRALEERPWCPRPLLAGDKTHVKAVNASLEAIIHVYKRDDSSPLATYRATRGKAKTARWALIETAYGENT